MKMADKRALEADIKQSLLDNPQLFRDLNPLGEYKIVFEKMAMRGKLIADAMLFSQGRGIIGIEIKTEYDTLKRLSRQLTNYVQTCNYTYVYVHDSHLADTIKLIKQKGYWNTVGVISYTLFDGLVIPGVVHRAQLSPYYHVINAIRMVEKPMVRLLLSMYGNRQTLLLGNTFHANVLDIGKGAFRTWNPTYGSIGPGAASSRLSYNQLTTNFVQVFGEDLGTRLVCETMLSYYGSIQKRLKFYQFTELKGSRNISAGKEAE